MSFAFLKSKFFIFVGTVALIFVGYSLVLQLNRSYEVHKQISDLQTQIQQFQSQNDDMLKLIAYLKTQEYQERQARPLLNLQKPGEFAVALPPQPEEQDKPVVESAQTEPISNLRSWWNYFFSQHS